VLWGTTPNPKGKEMKRILLLLALIGLTVWYYYEQNNNAQEDTFLDDYLEKNPIETFEINQEVELNEYSDQLRHHTTSKKSRSTRSNQKFKCDGRQYCSQMHSCEEAKFFLNNCPNTKMDGGRSGEEPDGIPCERQWCH